MGLLSSSKSSKTIASHLEIQQLRSSPSLSDALIGHNVTPAMSSTDDNLPQGFDTQHPSSHLSSSSSKQRHAPPHPQLESPSSALPPPPIMSPHSVSLVRSALKRSLLACSKMQQLQLLLSDVSIVYITFIALPASTPTLSGIELLK